MLEPASKMEKTMANSNVATNEQLKDPPTKDTVGIFIVAMSGVLLVFSEAFATLGAFAAAFLDVGYFSVTTWLVALAFIAPPTSWLFARFLKIAIESELRVDEEAA